MKINQHDPYNYRSLSFLTNGYFQYPCDRLPKVQLFPFQVTSPTPGVLGYPHGAALTQRHRFIFDLLVEQDRNAKKKKHPVVFVMIWCFLMFSWQNDSFLWHDHMPSDGAEESHRAQPEDHPRESLSGHFFLGDQTLYHFMSFLCGNHMESIVQYCTILCYFLVGNHISPKQCPKNGFAQVGDILYFWVSCSTWCIVWRCKKKKKNWNYCPVCCSSFAKFLDSFARECLRSVCWTWFREAN